MKITKNLPNSTAIFWILLNDYPKIVSQYSKMVKTVTNLFLSVF